MDGDSKAWRIGELETATSLNQSRADRESGIERTVSELNSARQVVTIANDPEEWAKITMDLGNIHLRRRQGGQADNLESAINYFTEALTVYQPESHPKEWALCHSYLAKAYRDLDLCNDSDPRLKELSLLHSRIALALVTKENFPELWHKIHLDLSLLHKKHALYSGSEEDLRLSDEHYRFAFDVDREMHTGLYEVLRSVYDSYSKVLLLRLEIREMAP